MAESLPFFKLLPRKALRYAILLEMEGDETAPNSNSFKLLKKSIRDRSFSEWKGDVGNIRLSLISANNIFSLIITTYLIIN